MEKITIKLHIDFEESIDVRSFTNLLDSIDKLFLYQALTFEENIYRLQESSEGLTPKCLEIREVNKGSVEIDFFVNLIITGLIYDSVKFSVIYGFKFIKYIIKKISKNEPICRSDIMLILSKLPPEDIFEIRNICKCILNSNIKELEFTLPKGRKFSINRDTARFIINEIWDLSYHYPQRESSKTDFARRFLRNVPIKIYRDEFGRTNGSIYKNKSRYPVFFANERIKDFIYRYIDKLPEFYVEVEDFRVNGKTKYYEINGLSDAPL